MSKKNIFYGIGSEPQFVSIIDKMLTTEVGFIKYEDVIAIYEKRTIEEIKQKYGKVSLYPLYTQLKKAVTAIRKELQLLGLDFEYSNGSNAKEGFRYPEFNKNPLHKLKEAGKQSSKQELAEFCAASMGLLPHTWVEHFFQGTMVLLDGEQSKGKVMDAEHNASLRNIELIPRLYEAITNEQVLKFEYNAGYEGHLSVVFHPHFLKEYNSRWFLFGRMDKGDGTILEVGNCALDRIVGDIAIVDDISYMAAPNERYLHYFDDIIGVSKMPNAVPIEITIETLDLYTHNRIVTKPIHPSQKGIKAFDTTGRITICVIPNRELSGVLLGFGTHIRIISPDSYVDKYKTELEKMLRLYE